MAGTTEQSASSVVSVLIEKFDTPMALTLPVLIMSSSIIQIGDDERSVPVSNNFSISFHVSVNVGLCSGCRKPACERQIIM